MATQVADSAPKAGAKARSGYFFWVSVLLLAMVLIGFAPTLYARPYFKPPPIPFYLYVHGAVLTGWFTWLVVQTWLVRTRKTALHRKTGWMGAALAATILVVGPMATFGVIKRMQVTGLTLDDDMSALPEIGVSGVTLLEFASPIVWGNLVAVAAFGFLIGWAILVRTRTEYHKRLILIASIMMMPPALARISRWPVFGGEDSSLTNVVVLALLASVIAYDILTRRKPHPATLAGLAVVFVVFGGSGWVATTGFGQEFVRSLG